MSECAYCNDNSCKCCQAEKELIEGVRMSRQAEIGRVKEALDLLKGLNNRERAKRLVENFDIGTKNRFEIKCCNKEEDGLKIEPIDYKEEDGQ